MYEKFDQLLRSKSTNAYQVSKATGISQTVFSDWKRGKSNPKTDKLYKIAQHFGVSIEFFLNTETQKKNDPEP